ncbi:hypothetical protein MMC11_002550 [Xylographa trunciseda]|nr:hypothetical protein [Xylographa trunciseda]
MQENPPQEKVLVASKPQVTPIEIAVSEFTDGQPRVTKTQSVTAVQPSKQTTVQMKPSSKQLPSSPSGSSISSSNISPALNSQSSGASSCPSIVTDATASDKDRWNAAGGQKPFEDLNEAFLKNENNLKQNSNNRFDYAAMLNYTNGQSTPNFECDNINSAPCLFLSTDCSAYGPGGFILLTSLAALSNMLNVMYTSIGTAKNNVANDLSPTGPFIHDFDPSAAITTEGAEIALASLYGVLGLISTIVSGPAIAAASAIGTAAVAIGQQLVAQTGPPPDLPSLLSNIVGPAQEAYAIFAQDIFQKGIHYLSQKDAQGYTFQSFGIIMSNGNLIKWIKPDETTVLIPTIEKALYMQMAVLVWNTTAGLYPFITFDKFPCGSAQPTYLSNLQGSWHSKVGINVVLDSVSVTIDQQCYYLLGANPSSCMLPWQKREIVPPVQDIPCCNMVAVPGATRTVLTGGDPGSAPYAGLLVDDFIIGSVNGWKANGKKNGYKGVTMDPLSFPKTVQDTGFVSTIPVCDFTAADPGINCPDVRVPSCAGPGTPQLKSAKPGKSVLKNGTTSVHSQLSRPSSGGQKAYSTSTAKSTALSVSKKYISSQASVLRHTQQTDSPSPHAHSIHVSTPKNHVPLKVPSPTPKAPSAPPQAEAHHNPPRYAFESEDGFQQFVLGMNE